MEDVVKQSIALMESKKRSTQPWQFDEPWHQPYYRFSDAEKKWIRTDTSPSPPGRYNKYTFMSLFSWNIDFMLPFPESRMRAGLQLLKDMVESQLDDTAPVIFLQECLQSDLDVLKNDSWIQSYFVMTDLDTENWQSGHYGTVTLLFHRLPIDQCFRVHYSKTAMERDVLVTDVQLGVQKADGSVVFRKIRLCNTHLESLALEPPYRPAQMQLTAQYMQDPSIDGAVVAGDFNAIQAFDRHLHSDNGLKDAYLERGGSEDDAEGGHTWGQQAATVLRDRFGTSRMDKVFFCGELGCGGFKRFGADVELADEAERKAIVELGFDRPWITDHLGVVAHFHVGSS